MIFPDNFDLKRDCYYENGEWVPCGLSKEEWDRRLIDDYLDWDKQETKRSMVN